MASLYEKYLTDDFYTPREIKFLLGKDVYTKNSLFIKNEELYHKYFEKDFECITQNGKKNVSKNLLIDLVSNEALYQYILYNYRVNSLNIVSINGVIDGKLSSSIKINKADLATLYYNFNYSKLGSKEKMRIASIIINASFESCLKSYNNYTFEAEVEHVKLSLPAKKIFEVLLSSEDDYNDFLYDSNYNGYDCFKLAYLITDFFKKENIMAKYMLPEIVVDRIISLRNYEIIDFENFDKINETNDLDINGNSIASEVQISEYLENIINNSYPKDASTLEKIINIYMSLCENLTYDQAFFASGNSIETHKMHESIEQINDINKENNMTVCYEFTMILAKVLKDMGVKYTLFPSAIFGYGASHLSLTFKIEEYIIHIDPLEKIFNNDLTNVKVGLPLTGLKCLNKNEITNLKFDELLYQVIVKRKKYIKKRNEFLKSLKDYHENYATSTLSDKEKLFILLKLMSSKNLTGIDTISHHYQLFRFAFQNNTNLSINFVASRVDPFKNYKIVPMTVISVKTEDGYTYFIINSNKPNDIKKMNHDELLSMFLNNSYTYINKFDHNIPGLHEGETYGRITK